MKKSILLSSLLFSTLSFSQVGIGTTTPVASAQLDVTSTTKGLLPPRMTGAQARAISSPVAGLMVWCTDCGTNGELIVYNGTSWTTTSGGFVCGNNVTFTYNGSSVTYGTVSKSYGGTVGTKCWLDRNLGATRVATTSADADAHGHLFQWGRGADGHQIRTSSTTTTLSSTDNPGNSNFILTSSQPLDWRNGQNANLWQGVNGTNNPCPSGFRIPTETEFDAERATWSSQNATGAYNSSLKLPAGGFRSTDGNAYSVGNTVYYWSSTVSGTMSRVLSGGTISNEYRLIGVSVRCIQN